MTTRIHTYVYTESKKEVLILAGTLDTSSATHSLAKAFPDLAQMEELKGSLYRQPTPGN